MNGIASAGRVALRDSSRLASSIALGALIVGVLDAADATLFSALYRGAPPGRVWQSVASGALGRAAFDGGTATVALGLAFHFFIAACVVVTYVLASRRWPVLARRWIVLGPLYGLVVYAVMNLVVIPLSAIGPVVPAPAAFINGILIHLVGVGLPSGRAAARVATAARRSFLGSGSSVTRDDDQV